MSVLIKGMEMPTRCGRCDMRISTYDDGIFDHYECCITAAIIDNLGEKMDDCPLVPVPQHGDLIDRDANLMSLRKVLYSPFVESGTIETAMLKACIKVFEEAPTIIPTEEGK